MDGVISVPPPVPPVVRPRRLRTSPVMRRLVAETGVRIEEDDYPRLATVASAAAFLAAASRPG